MTKQDAIKYLQQLYPNGGHCWLDEQRIEAIGIAINALQEEPVSEELETSIMEYMNNVPENEPEFSTTLYTYEQMQEIARYFANWQKEQFEKNRLHHCETLTEEQAKIESDFVVQHMKNNNRPLTCIDAIEYGMKKQKEQMMKDAKSGIGNYDNYIKLEDGTWIDLDPSMQLKPAFNVNEGDKVKVIVIKEE